MTAQLEVGAQIAFKGRTRTHLLHHLSVMPSIGRAWCGNLGVLEEPGVMTDECRFCTEAVAAHTERERKAHVCGIVARLKELGMTAEALAPLEEWIAKEWPG